MKIKQSIKKFLAPSIVTSGILLRELSAAASVHAQDKVKGEEMLRQARADLAEANRMSEAAVAATQKAQEDQEAATHKREEAVKLQRAAFLLIRDSNRMRAAEIRMRVDEQELQVKSEFVEQMRLQRLATHQQQTAAES